MEHIHRSQCPTWLQWLGIRYRAGNLYVFDWGEISKESGFSLGILKFDEPLCYTINLQLIYPNIFINIPYIIPKYEPTEMMDAWGVKYLDHSLHVNWGHRTWFINMPWEWVFDEEVRLASNITYDYTYIKENGDLQTTTAIFDVTHHACVWRVSSWLGLPLPKRSHRYIDVTFSDPIGEKVDTWKGGVTATSFPMKPDESPLQAIIRMEKEYRC